MTAPLNRNDRNRLRSTSNLWRALIPLVLGVGVLAFLSWPKSQITAVKTVDVAAAVADARRQTGLALRAPSGLTAGWRATSQTLHVADASSPASFLIGYQSPDGQYAEMQQSADAPDAVVASYGPVTDEGPFPVGPAAAATAAGTAPAGTAPAGTAAAGTAAAGTAAAGGKVWQSYRTSRGRLLLRQVVAGTPALTLIVTGGASTGELAALAAALG